MEKKRFIFDLDDTLLKYDEEYEKEFFQKEFGCEDPFKGELEELSRTYWNNYHRYVDNRLENFLSYYANIPIKKGFVERWINAIKDMPPTLEEGAKDTLDYLSRKGKSLVVLTNWYSECQEERMKKAGILTYFDKIYTGEFVLKPNKIAYEQAAAYFKPEEVLFIGDDVENDYIGPREFGYDAVLYDKKEEHSKSLVKIKKINELQDRY